MPNSILERKNTDRVSHSAERFPPENPYPQSRSLNEGPVKEYTRHPNQSSSGGNPSPAVRHATKVDNPQMSYEGSYDFQQQQPLPPWLPSEQNHPQGKYSQGPSHPQKQQHQPLQEIPSTESLSKHSYLYLIPENSDHSQQHQPRQEIPTRDHHPPPSYHNQNQEWYTSHHTQNLQQQLAPGRISSPQGYPSKVDNHPQPSDQSSDNSQQQQWSLKLSSEANHPKENYSQALSQLHQQQSSVHSKENHLKDNYQPSSYQSSNANNYEQHMPPLPVRHLQQSIPVPPLENDSPKPNDQSSYNPMSQESRVFTVSISIFPPSQNPSQAVPVSIYNKPSIEDIAHGRPTPPEGYPPPKKAGQAELVSIYNKPSVEDIAYVRPTPPEGYLPLKKAGQAEPVAIYDKRSIEDFTHGRPTPPEGYPPLKKEGTALDKNRPPRKCCDIL